MFFAYSITSLNDFGFCPTHEHFFQHYLLIFDLIEAHQSLDISFIQFTFAKEFIPQVDIIVKIVNICFEPIIRHFLS